MGEYIDFVLDLVLKKSFYYVLNGVKMIKFGDFEVEWDDNFCLYMMMKFLNFYYDLDVMGKMIIINYFVIEFGF